MTKSDLPTDGQVFDVRYPFVRCTFTEGYVNEEGSGSVERPSWKPGIEYVSSGPDGDPYGIAHGVGVMRLTVVGTYRPKGFPTRVFFTRRFVTPDGKEFGKSKLRIATAEKFRRTASGYQHDYAVQGETEIPK